MMLLFYISIRTRFTQNLVRIGRREYDAQVVWSFKSDWFSSTNCDTFRYLFKYFHRKATYFEIDIIFPFKNGIRFQTWLMFIHDLNYIKSNFASKIMLTISYLLGNNFKFLKILIFEFFKCNLKMLSTS